MAIIHAWLVFALYVQFQDFAITDKNHWNYKPHNELMGR
jgi:hypothetical protein